MTVEALVVLLLVVLVGVVEILGTAVLLQGKERGWVGSAVGAIPLK